MHPRLQILASGGSTISFLPVVYCKSAHNEPQKQRSTACNLGLSGLRGIILRFARPFFALFRGAQMQARWSSVHTDGFWEHPLHSIYKQKQRKENKMSGQRFTTPPHTSCRKEGRLIWSLLQGNQLHACYIPYRFQVKWKCSIAYK